MALVNITQLKMGDKLSDDVTTPLGGLLLPKGRLIGKKEVEILKAFLVPSVWIQNRFTASDGAVKTEDGGKSSVSLPMAQFQQEYDKLFIFLKKMFRDVHSGAALPILELRTLMDNLIGQIEQYNVIGYSPRNKTKDDYLIHNSILVSLTSYLLAKWSGIAQKEWMQLALAGVLHDIGNTKIDADILDKPDKLSLHENEEMKKHTVSGYNMLKNIPSINEGVKLAALQHHEKEDGSGYPLGLTADKIHFYAKVVAIADIYHAMTSNRSYKNAASPYVVLEELSAEAFGKLDPALVQIFISKATEFHNGMTVRLNDQRTGEIVFTDRAYPTRPWVKIDGQMINLSVLRELYIEEVIK